MDLQELKLRESKFKESNKIMDFYNEVVFPLQEEVIAINYDLEDKITNCLKDEYSLLVGNTMRGIVLDFTEYFKMQGFRIECEEADLFDEFRLIQAIFGDLVFELKIDEDCTGDFELKMINRRTNINEDVFLNLKLQYNNKYEIYDKDEIELIKKVEELEVIKKELLKSIETLKCEIDNQNVEFNIEICVVRKEDKKSIKYNKFLKLLEENIK